MECSLQFLPILIILFYNDSSAIIDTAAAGPRPRAAGRPIREGDTT